MNMYQLGYSLLGLHSKIWIFDDFGLVRMCRVKMEPTPMYCSLTIWEFSNRQSDGSSNR